MSAVKKSKNRGKERLVGIDEAGRGPLAGPVAVGVIAIGKKDLLKWGRVRDSKQLGEKKREEIFEKIKNEAKNSSLRFAVSFGSVKEIDDTGITRATALGVARALQKLKLNPKNTKILLDGSLRAPSKFKNQKTIIKGDEKETIIALASIVAKVSRDRLMVRLSKKHSKYGFEIHKGYGTEKHIAFIRKFGLSKIHRKSFCRNLFI